MKHADAVPLFDVYRRALAVLAEAEPLLQALPNGEEKANFIDAHSAVIIAILSKLRAPLVIEYRDLNADLVEGPLDSLLDDIDMEIAERLTPAQVHRIDNALLAACGPSWSKIAMVVGTVMLELAPDFLDLSDTYYALRIVSLVAEGRLASQGDLDYMRFSEVRLWS